MKKLVLILFVLTVVTSYACKQNHQTDDPDILKAVLSDFFDGLRARDIEKIKDITTEDFILFEDGLVWNNDSLQKFLNYTPKFSIEYKFDNFKINMDKSTGNMRYFNNAEGSLNDTTHLTMKWLESATFKKVDDKWKLEFLHSTVRK